MDVCYKTWAHQQVEGNVFLSEKTLDGSWREFNFTWPTEKKAIAEWFRTKKRQKTNLYWCPTVFEGKRQSKNALKSRVLFADLDPIVPTTLPVRPTVAWETSTGRYQALWFLDQSMDPEFLEKINQRLTYSIGADKSGWDITQILRIPETTNFKYTPEVLGKLLWDDNNIYDVNQIELPPAIETANDVNIGISLVELLSKYRSSIPTKISRLLQYPPERIAEGHRSDMLWSIESELIQAKIPMEDVIQMVRLSAWNKYKGRKDEMKRLTTEIQKVYENLQKGEIKVTTEIKEIPDLPVTNYMELMSSLQSEPGWLVKDLWMRKSHGIMAGEPKTYKSTVSLDMAVSVASGLPLWGKYEVEDQGPVLIIQNENAEWIMKDRLEKIVASKHLGGMTKKKGKIVEVTWPPELPIYFVNNYGYNFNDPLHKQQLEVLVKEIRPVLIIMDPLYLMFDGDINHAKDLQPVLQWLLDIKNRYRTAIMVIHHWNKSGTSSRGGQRMLGSTTLHGWTESALYLQSKEDEDDPEKIIVTIEREFRAAGMYPKLDLSIQMGDFGDPTYVPQLTEAPSGASTRNDLLDLLSMHPAGLSSSQVAKELSISRKKVIRMAENHKLITIVPGPRGAQVLKLLSEVD